MRFELKNNNTRLSVQAINNIAHKNGVSPEIIKLINNKGYDTEREIVSFLNPQNFTYHNPFLLSGMNEAVSIIKSAISNKKRITVIGDYDTDGICSTAILYKYFESMGVKIDYFLPNRFTDGYGVTIETINKIIELYNPELLITVDCGISSYEEIEYAKSKGIEVIVTDHHEIPPVITNCVVIDPKLDDHSYPFKELCGAGVALKLVHALKGLDFVKTVESIAALATVADIVPLKDENRAIVYNGLKNYKTTLPFGIKKLLEKLKLTNLQSVDIAFKLAPKLNAAGRMGDANIAFQLFIENRPNEVNKLINILDTLNEQRVSDGLDIYDECLQMLNNVDISNLRAIVLYKPEWNGGVLGIICAKLVEKFNKPVCLISRVENEYKGSIRSIEGIDIYEQLSKLSHLLVRFGGHSQAGGLSIEEQNIEAFSNALNENLKAMYDEKLFEQVKYYDMDLSKIDITEKFVNELDRLEPYGFGNEKPVFKITLNNAKIEPMKNNASHLKIKINNIHLVAFNANNYKDILQTNSTKEFLIELNTNSGTTKNHNTINGIVKFIKIGKLNTSLKNKIVNANIINQLHYLDQTSNHTFKTIKFEDIKNILSASNFGTLIVTNNFNNYNNFLQQYSNYIINYEVNNIINQTGENTILFCPNYDLKISNYTNVIILEPIFIEGYLNNFNCQNIYILDDNSINLKMLENVSTSRDVFVKYHTSILNLVKRKIVCDNEYDYFTKLVKLNPQNKKMKYEQFVFVLMVLKELKIINIINNEVGYYLEINNVKSDLKNSNIYNYIDFINKVA